MDVLLTGATGFIGRNLLKFLLSKKIRVYCIVRNINKFTELFEPSDFIKPIEGDLLDDSIYLKLPLSVDVVIHLAAMLGKWNVNEEKIMKANLDTTVSLLDWFYSSEGKHFIFISTPGVQGFGHKLAKETEPNNPRGIYEKTKVLAEEAIKNGNFRSKQNWTIIRPDFVYGPGDMRRIKLYKWIRKRQWIRIGNGKSHLRPTHVYDVCKAICICLQNPKTYFQIFNIGGPEIASCDDYVNTIAEILGVKISAVRMPTFLAIMMANFLECFSKITNTKAIFTKSQVEFLTQHHATDISKIRNTLGFTPTVDLKTGMDETLNWAKKNYLI